MLRIKVGNQFYGFLRKHIFQPADINMHTLLKRAAPWVFSWETVGASVRLEATGFQENTPGRLF
jgi:hypothetical protein